MWPSSRVMITLIKTAKQHERVTDVPELNRSLNQPGNMSTATLPVTPTVCYFEKKGTNTPCVHKCAHHLHITYGGPEVQKHYE